MSEDARRPDSAFLDVDIPAALAEGLPDPGDKRSMLFSDGVIGAALRLEDLGIGPYPTEFLASCVQAMGLSAATELPEPLIGAQPTQVVRAWMTAAASGREPDVVRDDLFAQWLSVVAEVLAARRRVRKSVPQSMPESAGDSATVRDR
ncbi:hypothetical protein [Nocardia sp. NBC_01327]|uniref:hypothetical protein n=1 Tax=Nocardia sp. NBC_01327 TaxID=2903593 RepID=UPI002E130246|nr:hypothetical protein OG326_42195 [Nocardia sp. NBC_01327]